jgi:hypothetical protein
VAFTAPVPRPPRGLSTQPRRPLNDALTSPWVSADSLPFLSGAPDLSESLRSMCSPTVSLADAHSELGPCSLDPAHPFRECVCRAYLGPDSAYRLLQLHFRHASNQTSVSRFPRKGRRPRPPSFSFLPRPLPCGSGDRWRAALRPIRSSPGAGSSRFHGFARPRCCFERITLDGYPRKG